MDGSRFNKLTCTLMLVLIAETTYAYNALEGKRAACSVEGGRVAVDHIDKHNCFSCICKNGFVECKSDNYCPPTEGCHMLMVEKTGCCRRCKECSYRGVHHQSHTEWKDPDNPCKVLRCEAGVITESDQKCLTPCANPLPPQPGKCCPTCPVCKINGQVATDDRDVISDDPCVKCRCKDGQMTCSKRACPVLQCTHERQEHLPGECCPRCSGTRSLLNVPRSCTLQNSFFQEGQRFNIDKCTMCVCQNETSVCQRAACPILDCAPEMQKAVPGACCKQCVMPEGAWPRCSHDNKYYKEGTSWKLDDCRSCECLRGMPSCAMTRCNVTKPCAAGRQLVLLPGKCCEECIEVPGVCMVFGDPHYKTFDGKIYTFQGIGKYQLVSDCKTRNFSIRVANDFTNTSLNTSTTTKRVAIRYGDLRLNLQQQGRVKLNRRRVSIPYKRDDGLCRIEYTLDGNIAISLQNGIQLLWSGRSFLEVSVPAAFKNRLCGLCGNFNGNVQDEFRTRRGRLLKDSEVFHFGSAWCTGPREQCNGANRIAKQLTRMPSCTTHHRPDKNRCKALNHEELFGDCDSRLNYNKYYKACKMDMCNCPSGKCYCDSLMAYSRECQRLGVKLPNWRKLSMCEEHDFKRIKTSSRRPVFSHLDIENLRRPRNFNRTRMPLLID